MFAHGQLENAWDAYARKWGTLSLHLHKLDSATLARIDKLVAAAVRRGEPVTPQELEDAGYRHPVQGLYF